jgi:hypothetical protein
MYNGLNFAIPVVSHEINAANAEWSFIPAILEHIQYTVRR